MKYKATVKYADWSSDDFIFGEYEDCLDFSLKASKDKNVIELKVIEYEDITDRIINFIHEVKELGSINIEL